MELSLSLNELSQLTSTLNDAIALFGSGEALDVVGALVESQTHRRIQTEKTDPQGHPWEEWSADYARTRHDGQSLLMGFGDLDDSIEHHADDDEAVIGSNLIYAAAQQEGLDMTILSTKAHVVIPARPYLGLSADNQAELERALLDWAARRLHA